MSSNEPPIEVLASNGNSMRFVINDPMDIEDDDFEECPSPLKDRDRDITDKYLAGNITFQEFIRAMNKNIRGNYEEEDEKSDEDWEPMSKEKSEIERKESENRKHDDKNEKYIDTKDSHDEDDNEEEEEEEEDSEKINKFEEELEESRRSHYSKRKKSKIGIRSRRKRLDPALQGLMGEANLRFARGESEIAIRMCMEVIRQDPTAPEPFQTLATLYEEKGESEKSFQFALLAAHLAPQSSEEWARLADLSLELGDRAQAVDCYRKAIDADPCNPTYHVIRCNLLEQLGETKTALRGYKRFVNVLRSDQSEDYIGGAKEIARILHSFGDILGAKNAIALAFKKHSQSVKLEDVNLYLELLISLENYEEGLSVLIQWCSVQFFSQSQEITVPIMSSSLLSSCSTYHLPATTPLDIRAKLIVILIHLNAHSLSQGAICDILLDSDPNEFGDLLLDVSEALTSQSLFSEALPYLKKLVNSESYNKPAVWLDYGACLYGVSNLEEAKEAFLKVVELAPNHHDARKTLSNIFHQLGQPEEALRILTQDESAELLNSSLLYEKCILLKTEGQNEEFINKAKMLFYRHFIHIRNSDELMAVASSKKLTYKNRALCEVRAFRREPLTLNSGPAFDIDKEVAVENEFDLFQSLCSLLFDLKRFDEFQRLAFSALGSPYFNKHSLINKECEFLCLISAYCNGDSYHAYNLARELVIKRINNPRVWNLFNLVIMRADDARHNRFLIRLMTRHPDNLALGILNGHNCLVAGTYKHSLGEYMSAFKQDTSNPMIALMLALTFTHMACQKFSSKKHSLVVQACSFFNNYIKLRGESQETNYNLGRAMHQLGLLPPAIHYYKKVLKTPPSLEGDIFNLAREAAFNLSLIYQGSGSYHLARMYIQKYIVI